MGTLQQTGDAETEDEGGLRARVQAEGACKWSVPGQSRRARERELQEWTAQRQGRKLDARERTEMKQEDANPNGVDHGTRHSSELACH